MAAPPPALALAAGAVASSTRTGIPTLWSARAVARPAMPAPATTTGGASHRTDAAV
eukprot:CAMPEP_0119118030 /NCGR_PEP_ID=MMETSP1180-20130426/53172_1 /TAXON_ID=3052 ORGANISM="Chlamydomonas cf sp, Strain CCMP681" /NCGR_SAMPLE_ID=MMETSP1180 /ASSEMBLY_ACC=CAM_ASM_000741 /LENGTH=55 /DNA_ID=CAMNT_0007107361 /DNA_START=1652 /DNA_END=1819 /DNA_ORIENTATION=+